jgi:hypothetical protein
MEDRFMNRTRGWARGVMVLALVAGLAAAGCGGKGNGGPVAPTVQTLLAQAWQAFGAGDFATAKSKFQQALDKDPTVLEGSLGLGWSDTFLGNLATAETVLEQVAGRAPTPATTEFIQAALAGLTVVRLALDDAGGTVSAGEALLAADPDWSFAFRPSVNVSDVRLAMAEALVTQGEGSFEAAQAQLDILDPSNGLDPTDAGSWVVDGIAYGSYEAALVKALEAVEAGIGESILFGARPVPPAHMNR